MEQRVIIRITIPAIEVDRLVEILRLIDEALREVPNIDRDVTMSRPLSEYTPPLR